MYKFFYFFLISIIFVLLIAGFLILTKNNFRETIFKPLATIKEALSDLFTFSQPEIVDLPIVKKEDLEEEENIKEEKNFQKEPNFNPELNLDEIVEKLDEISEKIDLLTQEVEKLLGKEIEKSEFSEETEKEDENEISEEEKLEEVEDESEQIVGEAKTPENNLILCEKGGQSSTRNLVILNEISWMGTNSDWRNEWIELKNISNSEISLKGWQILDKNEEIKIIFKEKDMILFNQFFLLERTNDDAVPNILADKIYSGNLNDEDEILYLFDENCQLQDDILALPDWPAGDKNERKSMERDSNLTWYTYSGGSNYGILGTPKAENSPKFTSTGGGAPPPEEVATPPPKILITEVQIEGEVVDNDFIELYNSTDSDLDISGYKLRKKISTGNEYSIRVFPQGSIIRSKDYFLWANSEGDFHLSIGAEVWSTTTLAENNSIALFNLEDIMIDALAWGENQISFIETVSFSQNPDGNQSLGRKWLEETEEYQDTDNNQEDFEIQSPTPKEKNQNSSTLLPPVVEDDIAPEVSFDSISSLQTETQFLLSWVGQDFALESATSSGIDAFYLQYKVTPNSEGVIIQYQDEVGNLLNWLENEIIKIPADVSSLNVSGNNFHIYNFTIQARDKAGNEGDWDEVIIEINTLPIVINEIAWMGTNTDWRNEWMEILNNTNQTINLAGWVLKVADGTPEINLDKEILPEGFYLLERTDDDTLPDILADQIYTGALNNDGNNDGEELQLFDNSGNLIERINCSVSWFAGDNDTKQTMERKDPNASGSDPNNWKTSQEVGGTPKAQNSQ